MDDPSLTHQVHAALRGVLDPEIRESIVDLGLVARIETGPGRVEVLLIPTSATCPMTDLLVEDAARAVARVLPAGLVAQVRLDAGLAWTPARMSPTLQQRFGWQTGEPGAR